SSCSRSSLLSSLTLSLLFSFVSSHRDHPHLHSFPTRRSSDLAHQRSCRVPCQSRCTTASGSWHPASGRGSGRSRSRTHGCRGTRSEEHTSELQSRENLVCRLLLEKKKKGPCKSGD